TRVEVFWTRTNSGRFRSLFFDGNAKGKLASNGGSPASSEPDPAGARRRVTGGRSLLVDRDRQAMTALAAAALEDLAAAGGGHASAEAVRAGAAGVVGLVRALHDVTEIGGTLSSTLRRAGQVGD